MLMLNGHIFILRLSLSLTHTVGFRWLFVVTDGYLPNKLFEGKLNKTVDTSIGYTLR